MFYRLLQRALSIQFSHLVRKSSLQWLGHSDQWSFRSGAHKVIKAEKCETYRATVSLASWL